MKTETNAQQENFVQRAIDLQCRFCDTLLRHTFVDLGTSPLCESYVPEDRLNHGEVFYPLHVLVCEECYLVQLDEYVSPEEIFSEYAYFSSYADTWLEHARQYVEMITERLDLDTTSQVVELASNDGYLLQYFEEKEVPALGVEPAENVAQAAIEKGIDTRIEFFDDETARSMVNEGLQADLVIGNNVLAQVPNLNSFVSGMKRILKPGGVITLEFPHLVRLMEENQFDTIYHEHFSYFSLITTERIFEAHGLTLFDVEELSTHGGSLRVYGCHDDDSSRSVTDRVKSLRDREIEYGLTDLETYSEFAEQVRATKRQLLDFLITARQEDKTVVGYGAPGKGNTLLNYCGVRTDFLDYTVDRNPYKQGMYLPGTRIPIYAPDKIRETKPDYVLILPWNFKDEIMEQMADVRSWGGKFVIPIPEVRVVDE